MFVGVEVEREGAAVGGAVGARGAGLGRLGCAAGGGAVVDLEVLGLGRGSGSGSGTLTCQHARLANTIQPSNAW